MLPWIIGVVVVGVGSYLLEDAKSSNSRARNTYDDTRHYAEEEISNHYYHAQRKEQLDQLFKMKKAKRTIADSIYKELCAEQESLTFLREELKGLKVLLNTLFADKHASASRKEKQQLQTQINVILASRQELFAVQDGLKESVFELKHRLKEANKDTRMVQDTINNVLED